MSLHGVVMFVVLAVNQLFHLRIEITIKQFKLNLSP